MNIEKGYLYHIKDDYFDKAKDDKLMKNKENNAYRPVYYCANDKDNSGILWFVPISSQVEKFKKIYNRKIEKNGKCDNIVFGRVNGQECAFLIQNMFPITEKYIDHAHTVNNMPFSLDSYQQRNIDEHFQTVMKLVGKDIKGLVFPDVKRLKQIMLDELQQNKKDDMDKTAATEIEKSVKNSTLIIEGLTFDDDKSLNVPNKPKTSDKGLSYIDKLLSDAKAGADVYNNRQRQAKAPEKESRNANLDL